MGIIVEQVCADHTFEHIFGIVYPASFGTLDWRKVARFTEPFVQLECYKKKNNNKNYKNFSIRIERKLKILLRMTSTVANTFHSTATKCYSYFFASSFPETSRLAIAFSQVELQ